MASIPCSFYIDLRQAPSGKVAPWNGHSSSTPPSSPSVPSLAGRLRSPFLGLRRRLGCLRATSRLRHKVGTGGRGGGPRCWFKFGNRGVDAEGAGIYGSQGREDFDRDDVEQYFNYMGMLAVEGSYDKMETLLSQNIHPVDILLLMAASEGDKPKIEELLRAGAKSDVKDADGKTALDRAANEEIKELILGFSFKNV
uniref:Protein LHCP TRANSLOCATION DEFECT n=1 Tax=Anthurium amnicola TaxID=1678845 RepID=A0A1D1XQA6_9ARAE